MSYPPPHEPHHGRGYDPHTPGDPYGRPTSGAPDYDTARGGQPNPTRPLPAYGAPGYPQEQAPGPYGQPGQYDGQPAPGHYGAGAYGQPPQAPGYYGAPPPGAPGGPPPGVYYPPPKKNNTGKTIGIVAAVLVGLCVLFSVIGSLGDDTSTTNTATDTTSSAAPASASPVEDATKAAAPSAKPSVQPSSTAPVVKTVTMPDVEGQNLQVAWEQLKELGFTNILPASLDEDDKVVLYPPNWTIDEQTTPAGTKVKTDATIVLKCHKG